MRTRRYEQKLERIEQLTKDVKDHPQWSPEEKETSIGFTRPDSEFDIFTAESGIARRVLRHPEFSLKELTVRQGTGFYHCKSDSYTDGQIVAVRGAFPVSVLKISDTPRSETFHYSVVSDYSYRNR